MNAVFSEYVDHGWRLCRIKEKEKGPRYSGWNLPENALTAEQAEAAPGAGLMHAYSGTCALDIDDIEGTRAYLAKRGIDLDALLNAPDAVGISSGTPNRAKLLFSLPDPLPTKKVTSKDKKVTLFELRCADAQGKGTVQDVLPGSRHPSGRVYEWRYGDDLTGDWRNPPPLPESLRALWRELTGKSLSLTDTTPPSAAASPSAGTSPAQGVVSVGGQPSGDFAAARAILDATDPDCDYDTWIKLGMALEHELGADGWAMWYDWSAKGRKYPGAAQLESHWNSFGRSPTPITLGTFKRQLAASKDQFDDLTQVDDSDPFEAAREKAKVLRVVPIVDLASAVLPEQAFVMVPLLPRGVVTLFGGHGDAGKSYTAAVITAHVACGKQFGPVPVHQVKVLFVSLEDRAAVVWARLRWIAEAYGLDVHLIEQNVTVVAVDEGASDDADPVLATEVNDGGVSRLDFTPAFEQVVELAKGCGLVVIDNASDAFDANENNRRLVRHFIRALQRRIAQPNDAATMLLAHIDKHGARKGTDRNTYSGSTAWHNSVRSRLALTTSEDDDSRIELVHEKSNLAKRWRETIHLVRSEERGVPLWITKDEAQRKAQAAAEETSAPVVDAVLAALRAAEADGVPVPCAKTGPSPAASVLRSRPGFPAEYTPARINDALDQLERARRIRRAEYTTPSRHKSTRYAVILEHDPAPDLVAGEAE